MNKINENLFDLTAEEIATSKMMYNNKVIKCLVAPFHSYAQLETEVPYTQTTYLFPERDMSGSQITGLISMIVKNKKDDEFRIITTNMNVITDMVDTSVRVLTEAGEVVPCPCKTFAANIHTIRYDILENDAFRISKKERSQAHDKINVLIKKVEGINSNTSIEDKLSILNEIKQIGEPIIKNKLWEMYREKTY